MRRDAPGAGPLLGAGWPLAQSRPLAQGRALRMMLHAVARPGPQPPRGAIKVGYISDGRMYDKDSLPEWSKGVDSSSTSASCVGSNPTAVIYDGAPRFATARYGRFM